MREIKFRAWHETNKTMVYFNPKKAFKATYIGGHLLRLIKDKSEFLMQYTGLKDGNGVEIYEGDIVTDKYNRIMQVVWCPDLELGTEKISRLHFARWEFKVIKNMKGDYSDNFTFRAMNDWFYPKNCVEIIGNIYENPELLKNKAEL